MKTFNTNSIKILTVCLLTSISGCKETPTVNNENEINRMNEIIRHEENITNYYSPDKSLIRVIGYHTVYAKNENERLKLTELRKEWKELGEERKSSKTDAVRNIYINEKGLSYRLYFPVYGAIFADWNLGCYYYTDEKGVLKYKKISNDEKQLLEPGAIPNIYEITLIGREISEFVKGTAKNHAEPEHLLVGSIFLKHGLRLDGSRNPLKGIYHKEQNIMVFNMGEKIIDEEHRTLCYENHGNNNCSEAFGVSQGGDCEESSACMDSNGHSFFSNETDCNTFFLSDWCLAICAGHCWNEIE
jgi:hypothetical protein